MQCGRVSVVRAVASLMLYAAVAAMSMVATQRAASAEKGALPNIVIILVDDKYESPTSVGRKPTETLRKLAVLCPKQIALDAHEFSGIDGN